MVPFCSAEIISTCQRQQPISTHRQSLRCSQMVCQARRSWRTFYRSKQTNHRPDWRYPIVSFYGLPLVLALFLPLHRVRPRAPLTDIVNQDSELGILTDAHDQALDRCHQGRERQNLDVSSENAKRHEEITYGTGLVLLTSPVAVLEKRVKNTA